MPTKDVLPDDSDDWASMADINEEDLKKIFDEASTTFKTTKTSEVTDALRLHINENVKRLLRLEADDIEWKLSARKWFSRLAFGTLFAQNLAVFYLVFRAYSEQQLQTLQVVLSILVSATLIETVGAIKIMVQWIFKDVKYKIPKHQNLNSG